MKHISFEINRFRLASKMWVRRDLKLNLEPELEGPVRAMFGDSCLIHTRLLLDFFYPRPGWSISKWKDVFVTDYLPDRASLPATFQKLLQEPAWLQDYRDRFDWRLAHLTRERLPFDNDPSWRTKEPFDHLERLISEFLDALPPNMRALYNPHQQ